MAKSIAEMPLLKAKILAVLLKLADDENNINFENQTIEGLWAIGDNIEDHLFELNKQGAIIFEQVGEDGFAPITMCSISDATYDHLLRSLGELSNDFSLLDDRIKSILRHDPNKLKSDIADSQKHIQNARNELDRSPLLAPLKQPLDDISRHFESIQKVAENYDDVYKNILLPVQEEGKSGVRATVKWAIIGIAASWLISNLNKIWDFISMIMTSKN